MAENLRRAFNEGKQGAELKTHRQGIIRGVLQGTILAVAIFAPVSIILKIVIGIVGFFVLGVVATRPRFRGKL